MDRAPLDWIQSYTAMTESTRFSDSYVTPWYSIPEAVAVHIVSGRRHLSDHGLRN